MANVLIIYGHPKTPKSFNEEILKRIEEALVARNHNVIIRDLYALHFSSNLSTDDLISFHTDTVPEDILEEQNHIKNADALVFIYPIWWTTMPAIIKGYVDRVLSYGFAYKTEGDKTIGLLTDKKVIILNSTGTPKEIYEKNGYFECMKHLIDEGIFGFCGFNTVRHFFFAGTPSAKTLELQKYYKRATDETVALVEK